MIGAIPVGESTHSGSEVTLLCRRGGKVKWRSRMFDVASINSNRRKFTWTPISRRFAVRLLYGCTNPYTVIMIANTSVGDAFMRKKTNMEVSQLWQQLAQLSSL